VTKISIILPVYNEAKNIKILIPEIIKVMKDRDFEIVVVDGESTDKTTSFVCGVSDCDIVFAKREKKGIGDALVVGYDLASGDILLSMDADNQIDAMEIPKLLSVMEKNNYDMVIGARYLNFQKRTVTSNIHYLISKLGNQYIGLVNGTPFSDYSLNFRAMKKEVWKTINPTDKQNFFLVEMIVQAFRNDFKIGEIPIYFKKRLFGKSKTKVANQMGVFLFKGFLLGFKRRDIKRCEQCGNIIKEGFNAPVITIKDNEKHNLHIQCQSSFLFEESDLK